MWGQSGEDTLNASGSWHSVTLRGGSENDLLRGGYAQDLLSGGSGDDVIYAGDGRDMVFGGDGDDTLRDGIPFRIGDGSTGHGEIFSGGAGNDYIVDNGQNPYVGWQWK